MPPRPGSPRSPRRPASGCPRVAGAPGVAKITESAKVHHREADRGDAVSTGHLPPAETVRGLVTEAYTRFQLMDGGEVADYIPALAQS